MQTVSDFCRSSCHRPEGVCTKAEGELRPESRRALPQVIAVKLGREPLLPAFSLEQELHDELNQPRIHGADTDLAKGAAPGILG